MKTGFKTGPFFIPFGSGELLHAFFSTICYHLEDGDWGSLFPRIMNELYDQKLLPEHADEAIAELEEIREGLADLIETEVIWDIHDPEKPMPEAFKKKLKPADLSNYFVSDDGENLPDIILLSLERAKKFNRYVEISSLPV